jgi:hypothetical protein
MENQVFIGVDLRSCAASSEFFRILPEFRETPHGRSRKPARSVPLHPDVDSGL